jgi:hypothetical protein
MLYRVLHLCETPPMLVVGRRMFSSTGRGRLVDHRICHHDSELMMKFIFLCVCLVLLMGSVALAQTYNMRVHLKTGETVSIPVDEIRRIVFAQPAGVADPSTAEQTPSAFQLFQNYPNPFNPSTTIAYEIPRTSTVTIRIYDLNGALIKDLIHETLTAGLHRASWDGTDNARTNVASGAYFSVVQCGTQILSRRLILIK